jgi:hypothetical protein
MKYAVEVASGGTIYIPSFIEIDSDIQILLWDTCKHMPARDRQRDLIILALFFLTNESKLKTDGI